MKIPDWSYAKIKAAVDVRTKPTVIELYMPNCRPCKMWEAQLELLADEYEGEILFVKCLATEYAENYKGEHQYLPSTVPALIIVTPGRDYDEGPIIYGKIAMFYQSIISNDKLREVLDEELEKVEDL